MGDGVAPIIRPHRITLTLRMAPRPHRTAAQ